MLVGNLVSIFVGGIVCIFWSLFTNWKLTAGTVLGIVGIFVSVVYLLTYTERKEKKAVEHSRGFQKDLGKDERR